VHQTLQDVQIALGDDLAALPYPVYRARIEMIILELTDLYQADLPPGAMALCRRTAVLFGAVDAADAAEIDAVGQAWDELFDAGFDRNVPYAARSLCFSLRYAKGDLTVAPRMVAAFICGVVGGWQTRPMSPDEPYQEWIARMDAPADHASVDYQQLMRLTRIARHGSPD
jgi:hypothetical protein